jgi:uncharacterized membrane protein
MIIPKESWVLFFMAVCTVLVVVMGVIGYAHVPSGSQVAIHFDIHGNPNGWAAPATAFSTIPIGSCGLLLLQKFIIGQHASRLIMLVSVGANALLVVGQLTILRYALNT